MPKKKLTKKPVTLREYEARAEKKVKRINWNYIAGGAGDESGLHQARADLAAVKLLSRVLRNVESIDPSVTLFGEKISCPLLIAPCAYQGIVHSGGEVETARGAKLFETIMALSTLSSRDLEVVASSGAKLFFQLYFYRNRKITENLLRRAEEAGYRAIILTVDFPVVGVRYRDGSTGFRVPGDTALSRLLLEEGFYPQKNVPALAEFFATEQNCGLVWQDIEWLKKTTQLPILLKGILSPEDAKIAVKSGVSGIIISTHGGRQLDALVSPIQVLPEIRRTVGKSFPLFIDGEIRSGSDIVRSLCLGANAVFVGRPALWGLAVGGHDGVNHVLSLLKEELVRAMAILGLNKISEIDASYVYSMTR